LTPDESRLVRNYRLINLTRQDTLLYFSDELIKLEALDLAHTPNVVLLAHRK
jgi:hypothetical protein